MRRREFIALVGGAAAWPLAAGAQQQPAPPVIGYLSLRNPTDAASNVTAFRQGLKETGYVEGQNVAVEFRWADGQYDRLPALALDLVGRQVNVLVATGGTGSALAAKAATTTIPIVFAMGGDPVKLGVVASLARPGGNITGISFLVNELAAKEIELLHELAPQAAVLGFLVNPSDPNTESDTKGAQGAAQALGHKLVVVNASAGNDIDLAFATLAQQQAAALFVNVDPFLSLNRRKILSLAARHRMITVSSVEGFAADGGLISYGTASTTPIVNSVSTPAAC
jgi:putative ABC transport system substrate-binding protein